MDEDANTGNPADSDPSGGFNTDANGFVIVDPSDAGNSAGSGGGGGSGSDNTRRRRAYTRRGTAGGAADKTASLKGIDLKDILLSIHAMLAMQTGIPELMLEPEEAGKLDDAIKRVWRHYPVDVSQKQVDIGMAIYAVAMVYGTRMVKIYTDRKAPQRPAGADVPIGVMPFHRASA